MKKIIDTIIKESENGNIEAKKWLNKEGYVRIIFPNLMNLIKKSHYNKYTKYTKL